MAFISVHLHDMQNAMSLLCKITEENTDSSVILSTYETYTEYYVFTQQYDSTIYYVNLLQQAGYYESTCLVNKALAYYYLNINDSSLYYANKVINNSDSYGDNYNMLYIVIHADSTLSQLKRDSLISKRYDIGLILRNEQGLLSHSVELLEQHKKRKILLTRVAISFIVLIVLCFLVIILHVNRIRRNRINLQQSKEKLAAINNQILEQTHNLNKLKNEYELVTNKKDLTKNEIVKTQLLQTIDSIRQCPDFEKEFMWKDYKQMTHLVNFKLFNIISKISSEYPSLDEKDIRICILVILGFKYDEIANLIHRSPLSISRFKRDIAKKMGTKSELLQDFLIEKIIN